MRGRQGRAPGARPSRWQVPVAPGADRAAVTDTAPAPNLRLKFWLSCLAVLALPLGIAFATVYPKDLPRTLPVPNQAAMPDAPMPVDLYRFALNALLLPLLDDSIPLRWTDVAIDYSCEPGTGVTVDGEPLVAGKLIPAKAFTVRWNMDRCAPMGPESVALSGSVELLVFHEDAGLSAVVMPDRLRVDSHMGRTWLHGPFAAETSLSTSATHREPRAAPKDQALRMINLESNALPKLPT